MVEAVSGFFLQLRHRSGQLGHGIEGAPAKPQNHEQQHSEAKRFVKIERLELLYAGKIVHDPAEGKQDEDQERNQPVQRFGRGRVLAYLHRDAPYYHLPVFGIDVHGSAGGRAAPFCRSSIEMLSGERTKAMRPSRGGLLMVTPASIRR